MKTATSQTLFAVAQTSKSVVSQVSKPAGHSTQKDGPSALDAQPTETPAIQQTRRSALRQRGVPVRPYSAICFLLLLLSFLGSSEALLAQERLRLFIETDAGGDPDDEQSLVRFLLYTCEWDVEGIIANRPHTRRPENHAREDTGYGIVRALVNAYGACWTNLVGWTG